MTGTNFCIAIQSNFFRGKIIEFVDLNFKMHVPQHLLKSFLQFDRWICCFRTWKGARWAEQNVPKSGSAKQRRLSRVHRYLAEQHGREEQQHYESC